MNYKTARGELPLVNAELPLANASLVIDYEYIARAFLRIKLMPRLLDDTLPKIEQRLARVKHQRDQLDRSFGSAIRLCQIDYRRNVELARRLYPNKADRVSLIQIHTTTYKIACMYACRRYLDNRKLIFRIENLVNEFETKNERRTTSV